MKPHSLTLPLIALFVFARHGMAQRYIPVRDPGNPAAPPGSGDATGRGSVGYAFQIGRWEVTNSEWARFLDVVATGRIGLADPHGLYNPRMATDPRGGIVREQSATAITGYVTRLEMGDKPVSFVSYYDALRYCNWQHNNQSTNPDATEDGAYFMGSQDREDENQAFSRRTGARFWLPNLDEWAKAAFFDPATDTFAPYPGGDIALPVTATAAGECSNPGAGRMNFFSSADWDGQNGHVLTVGSCEHTSFFGAADMGGNAWDLTESAAAIAGQVTHCGGAYDTSIVPLQLTSLTAGSIARNQSAVDIGFRLATTDPPPLEMRFSFHPGLSEPVRITCPTHIGNQYKIQASQDLQTWGTRSIFFGSGAPQTHDLTIINNRPKDMFRLAEFPIPWPTPP